MNDLQKVDLEILNVVADLCSKNNLTYYAIGGTLLGAVRHKGFIPWDDDIDISLARPDYEKLISVCKQELSDTYEVRNFHTCPDETNPTFFSRICKKGTAVSLGWAKESVVVPVWIDIFPLDAMPTNGLLRNFQKYRLLYHRMKYQFSTFETNAHQHRANRPTHEKLLMKFCDATKIGQNWDAFKMLAQTEKAAISYDTSKEDYLVNMFGAYKFREMFPKEWLGAGIDLPFEDSVIHCPVDYDKVLTQLYGNYMQLPPVEQRSQQHCMTVITLGEDN